MRRSIVLLSCCVLTALLAGCVTDEKKPKNLPVASDLKPKDLVIPNDAGGNRTTTEETVDDSPCAHQLQELGGLLLQYYMVRRELPATLDVLRPLARGDVPSVCPTSNQPYTYAPGGLHLQGKPMMIVAFDSVPAHGGNRWCLLMSEPKQRGARTVDVAIVPEPVFRTYSAATPAN